MKPRSLRMIAGGAATLLGAATIALWFWSQYLPRIDSDDPAQISAGRQIYSVQCSSCHGKNLDGELGWPCRKASGHPCAPPLDATGHASNHGDRELFGLVKFGKSGTDMPRYRDRLSDTDIAAVLAFVKSSWTGDMRARQEHLPR